MIDNSQRFAFCVIAHSEPEVFKTLVGQIDHPDNDIFVIIDKKADLRLFDNVKTKYSKIIFCKNRINIKWGEISQVEAELEVFKEAINHGNYMYFHLISGQDLLIKPVSQLNAFMRANHGKEFLGLRDNEDGLNSTDFRLRYFHFFPHLCRNKSRLIQYIYFIPLKIQKILHIRRCKKPKFVMGSNWCSISYECVKYILNNSNAVFKKFRFSVCIDEMYKQYLISQSGYNWNIYSKRNSSFATDYLRKIDWERGAPYTWQIEDIDELFSSSAFFARKFSSSDKKLINEILKHTNKL